jgi:hypothetical protein
MPKKLKLSDLSVTSFVTNLQDEDKEKVKGGDDTIYPCAISAPQIVCMTDPHAYTCGTCYETCAGCGGTGGSNDYSCACIDG